MRFNFSEPTLGPLQRALIPPMAILALTFLMLPFRSSIGLVAVTALLLTAVMLNGLISSLTYSLLGSVFSGIMLNFFFIKPYNSLKIHHAEDIVGFVAYSMISVISVISIHGWKSNVKYANSAESIAERESQRADRGEKRLTWLNQISHDIRTPLSTVRAVVEDMQDGVEYDSNTQHDLLQIAVDEIDRLDLLVSNWLMFGSLESRPPDTVFSAIDLNEVVSDSVRRMSPLLRNNKVSLYLAQNIDQIDGNFAELQQLIINLLANAQRHTPPKTTISISTKPSTEGVEVSVEDSGPGFGVHNYDDLVSPFVVGERHGSSGLGLSICAEIVRRHNGQISLNSSSLGGARITSTFPRRERRKTYDK